MYINCCHLLALSTSAASHINNLEQILVDKQINIVKGVHIQVSTITIDQGTSTLDPIISKLPKSWKKLIT